jgi:acetoin utilization protein AcuB
MKAIPPIKKVMTPFPYWIDANRPLNEASRLMAERGISHLAVQDDGEIVGLISEREVERARGLHPAAGGLTVAEVATRQVYVVGLMEPLDRVLEHMVEHNVDAALVVKDGKLAGIFTTTDACRCFGQLLRTLFPKGGGDDAA